MTMRVRVASLVTSATLILAMVAGQVPAQAAAITMTNPAPIAWSPDGRYAYVGTGTFGSNTGTITRVDLTDNSTSTLVTMADPTHCHAQPTALAITPDGSKLYVGGYSCVFTIDLSNPSAYTHTVTWNNWVQEIVIGTDAAYAIHPEGGAIWKVAKTGGVWSSVWTELVPKGARPVSRGGALTPDGTTLFVADEDGISNLRQINTATGAETSVAGTGASLEVAVDPNGAFGLVLDGGRGIKKFELTTSGGVTTAGAVTTSASYGSDWMVRRIAIDRTGEFAYLGGLGDTRSIFKIRTSDLSVVSRTPLGTTSANEPSQIVTSPIATGKALIVTQAGENRILTLPMEPQAPTGLSATVGDGSTTVSFTPGGDYFSDITNYEYRLDGTGSWTALSPADSTSPVTISGLTNATAVDIELRAVNGIGSGAASSSLTVTPGSTPGAPRSVSVTSGDRQATINFAEPASNGGYTITNYEISLNGGSSWTTRTPASTTSPITVTGLSNGATYQIQLRAVNTLGSGAASASVNVTPAEPSAGGGTTTTAPEPSPSPSPTATVTTAPAIATVPEPVPVGESLIVVNGITTKIAVESVQGRKWLIRGADFTLEFIPQAVIGGLEGAFTAKAGTWVDVNGDGFSPGTLVASYLPGALADSLGQTTVNTDGTFSVRAAFPSSLNSGQYVFQVNGLSSPTSTRSVNLGLNLLAADPLTKRAVSKRVMFAADSAALTAKARSAIAKFARQHKSSAKSAIIVASAPTGATAKEKALAKARARAVMNAVKSHNSAITVRMAPRIRTSNETSAGKRATVWFRFTETR